MTGDRAEPVPPARRAVDIYAVVERPLSPDAIATQVDDPGAGGIVIFSGVVRNQTDGRPVKFLEYEAHAPMAEAKMREIGAAIRARWAGVRCVAVCTCCSSTMGFVPTLRMMPSSSARWARGSVCR